jgi:hypothetical protein
MSPVQCDFQFQEQGRAQRDQIKWLRQLSISVYICLVRNAKNNVLCWKAQWPRAESTSLASRSHRKLLSFGTTDRQCTYNVILRCVRVTTVLVEKQSVLHIVSVCVSSLSYTACKAHAPNYIVICGLCCYTIFYFTLPHKRHNFRKKKLLNTKLCFNYLCNSVWNISHSMKNWARLRRTQVFTYNTPNLFLSDLNDTWSSSTSFGKILKYKISWKSF